MFAGVEGEHTKPRCPKGCVGPPDAWPQQQGKQPLHFFACMALNWSRRRCRQRDARLPNCEPRREHTAALHTLYTSIAKENCLNKGPLLKVRTHCQRL
jgi:hypothetical protein